MTDSPPSARTTLRRGSHLASYTPVDIDRILDTGLIAHVAINTDTGPIAIPMAYGRDNTNIYIHGSVANAALRAARDNDISITITILNGLVIARSPLHNTMHYQSLVIRGTATIVDDTHKVATLKLINDHITPTWDTARAPSTDDIKRTIVLAVPLDETSAKISASDPTDDPGDLTGPHWAGFIPLTTRWNQPIRANNLTTDVNAPSGIDVLADTIAHPPLHPRSWPAP